VPLSVRIAAKSLRKSFGPATVQSMLNIRVQVCDVFWSRRNPSARPLVGKIIVKSTFPLTDPMTVSSSHGTTSACSLSHSHISRMVLPTRHLAFVFVSGLFLGLRLLPA